MHPEKYFRSMRTGTYGFTGAQHAQRSVHIGITDYTKQAVFFITLCTRERELLLGSIRDGDIHMTDIGSRAFDEWSRIASGLPGVQPGSWIIMPNHLHGIIMLGSNNHDFLLTSMIKKFRRNTNDFFHTHNAGSSSLWHPEHYVYRIQSLETYEWIHHYVVHNPSVWEKDKYFSK